MDDVGGWTQGQIYTTATFQGEESANSAESYQARFLDFLRSFRLDQTFTYRYNFLNQRSNSIEHSGPTILYRS
jgi:hypothetical protein